MQNIKKASNSKALLLIKNYEKFFIAITLCLGNFVLVSKIG